MKTPPRRPSMAEVAQRAGVSHQTVSRVINNSAGVRPKTRERIEAAIEELGYRRNNAARTLVTRRSGLIGVIAAGSFLYGPTQTLAGIEIAARHRKFTTLLNLIEEHSATDFHSAINNCRDHGAEAIVVIAAQADLVEMLNELRIETPLIAVGPEPDQLSDVMVLSVNQVQGGRIAVEHLANLGHRRIHILGGPENWNDAAQRLRGAVDSAEHHGIEISSSTGDWSAGAGYACGLSIAQTPRSQRPSAIFAANDTMALGVLAALHHHGIAIGSEISVIGFDDIPEAGFFSPALTTIRQDFITLGEQIVESVRRHLDGYQPTVDSIASRLVVRDSTGRP